MAAGLSPNSENIDRVGGGAYYRIPITASPEYVYNREDWMKLRDVLAGQKEVKRKGEFYLPRMGGMDDEDYVSYLARATFFNMTAQTQIGMLGQVFRKDPKIQNLPLKFKDAIRLRFTKDGAGHVAFAKTILSEQIAMGRFGVLVDAPAVATIEPTAFSIGYTCENIIDWDVKEINGVFTLTRVLLREFERDPNPGKSQLNPWLNNNTMPFTPASARGISDGGRARNLAAAKRVSYPSQYGNTYTYEVYYRELCLEPDGLGNWVYVQKVYKDDLQGSPLIFTPIIRGINLNFIPFKFFGSMSNSPSVERSPMLDIAELNLSHYRTYADLEHGRVYTALPVYYAPGGDADGAAEYYVGPARVWEVPKDSKPGILEYSGTGLKTLETALATKESQIASIGGRLMPGLNRVSESGNQTVLREANEQAVLLNCILTSNTGMSEVIRWWLMFLDVPMNTTESLAYNINQEFLSTPIGAREIRAIQLMYNDGLVGVEQLYDYLQRAEVVDAGTSLEDFAKMLKDPDSFLNSPDAQARQRGFADRKQELDQASQARELDMQQQEIDLQDREVTLMENAPPPLPPKPPAAGGAALPARPSGPVSPKPGKKKKV